MIPSDKNADLCPTQILAETFRTAGCDGIRYKSRLGKGYSFAFFSPEKAPPINCGIYETKDVALIFTRPAIRILLRSITRSWLDSLAPGVRHWVP